MNIKHQFVNVPVCSVSRADCAFNVLSNMSRYLATVKDGILQQSLIELLMTLSLGFREERMHTAVKGKTKLGYNDWKPKSK